MMTAYLELKREHGHLQAPFALDKLAINAIPGI
jgi:hypothetical protein